MACSTLAPCTSHTTVAHGPVAARHGVSGHCAALGVAHSPRRLAGAAGGSRRPVAAAAAVQSQDLDTKTIDDLSTSYCDDFVCTSSPSVEAGVRAAAKCIERANGKWAPSRLASNVEYQDPVRRFRGPEGYTRLDLIPSTVASPEVVVSRLRMLDNATAQIDWRLTGSLGPFPLDLVGTTTLSLNLLTGRIEAQREAWDLSATPLPGRVAWSAAAAAWAVRRVGKDAAAATGRAIDTLSSSLDEEETIHPPGPNDPMRFFQQRDTGKQDAITFTAVVALFWLLTQAYSNLQGF